MIPSVVKVIPLDNYVLTITFDNGQTGVLNLQSIINFGVFSQLKDPEIFRQVRVAFDTIEWQNGIDIDPEYVYKNCKFINQ